MVGPLKTNIFSHKAPLEKDVLFPQVGYVGLVEGRYHSG